MLEDEHAYFTMCRLVITEQGFISANATSRNGRYTDLY